MKNIVANFNASLTADVSAGCYLAEIVFRNGGTWRVCDSDIDIMVSGNIFSPYPFTYDNFNVGVSGEIERIVTSLDNSDNSQTPVFRSHDQRKSTLKFWYAALDFESVVIDRLCLFAGYLESCEFVANNVVVSWVSPLYASMQSSLNHLSASCINGFKDSVCAYDGTDVSCGHTYTDCSLKGNTANFRGGVVSVVSGKMAKGEIR